MAISTQSITDTEMTGRAVAVDLGVLAGIVDVLAHHHLDGMIGAEVMTDPGEMTGIETMNGIAETIDEMTVGDLSPLATHALITDDQEVVAWIVTKKENATSKSKTPTHVLLTLQTSMNQGIVENDQDIDHQSLLPDPKGHHPPIPPNLSPRLTVPPGLLRCLRTLTLWRTLV